LAEACGVHRVVLRRKWVQSYSVTPQDVLRIGRVYSEAMAWHERGHHGTTRPQGQQYDNDEYALTSRGSDLFGFVQNQPVELQPTVAPAVFFPDPSLGYDAHLRLPARRRRARVARRERTDGPPVVAVVGSRSCSDYALVERTLDAAGPVGKILTGGHKGADSLVRTYADKHGIPLTVINPPYRSHGDEATMERDKLLLAQADRLIAFWDGRSRGTNYTTHLARRLGIDYEVVAVEQ